MLAAIKAVLPEEKLVYVADQAHIPYGERSLTEVRAFSMAITQALVDRGCKLVVIACNTASAAALEPLRSSYPAMRFVGMEPAVKPAAEQSTAGVVGVLATSATFQGELFASVVERFAQGVQVLKQPCPGLVEQIEAGEVASPRTETMLRGWIGPMLARGIDALVLACTHYPFVRPLIERIAGPGVRVIDPAPAIARQVQRVLGEMNALAQPGSEGGTVHYTSGDTMAFLALAGRLAMPVGDVRPASWSDDRLILG